MPDTNLKAGDKFHRILIFSPSLAKPKDRAITVQKNLEVTSVGAKSISYVFNNTKRLSCNTIGEITHQSPNSDVLVVLDGELDAGIARANKHIKERTKETILKAIEATKTLNEFVQQDVEPDIFVD
tara:strand:- start:9672 stop:10049 length:378 start_codon:yes stop_codon:yes gene_type:complete